MKFIKGVIGLLAIGAAGAAVAGKVVKDKQMKDELDEFLIPSQEDPIVYNVPKESSASLKEAIYALANHEPKIEYFDFYVADSESSKKFQEQVAELEMSSSYDAEKSQVEVEYRGNFDQDDLDLLLVQLSEICTQTSASFVGVHEG